MDDEEDAVADVERRPWQTRLAARRRALSTCTRSFSFRKQLTRREHARPRRRYPPSSLALSALLSVPLLLCSGYHHGQHAVSKRYEITDPLARQDSSLRIVPANDAKTATTQETTNSFGLHDTLRYGPRSLAAEVKSTSAVKHRLENVRLYLPPGPSIPLSYGGRRSGRRRRTT